MKHRKSKGFHFEKLSKKSKSRKALRVSDVLADPPITLGQALGLALGAALSKTTPEEDAVVKQPHRFELGSWVTIGDDSMPRKVVDHAWNDIGEPTIRVEPKLATQDPDSPYDLWHESFFKPHEWKSGDRVLVKIPTNDAELNAALGLPTSPPWGVAMRAYRASHPEGVTVVLSDRDGIRSSRVFAIDAWCAEWPGMVEKWFFPASWIVAAVFEGKVAPSKPIVAGTPVRLKIDAGKGLFGKVALVAEVVPAGMLLKGCGQDVFSSATFDPATDFRPGDLVRVTKNGRVYEVEQRELSSLWRLKELPNQTWDESWLEHAGFDATPTPLAHLIPCVAPGQRRILKPSPDATPPWVKSYDGPVESDYAARVRELAGKAVTIMRSRLDLHGVPAWELTAKCDPEHNSGIVVPEAWLGPIAAPEAVPFRPLTDLLDEERVKVASLERDLERTLADHSKIYKEWMGAEAKLSSVLQITQGMTPDYNAERSQAIEAVKRLCGEHQKAQGDLERERVRLAGCLVAAEGSATGQNDVPEGGYGWSTAYAAVKKLREGYDRRKVELDEQYAALESLKAEVAELRLPWGPSRIQAAKEKVASWWRGLRLRDPIQTVRVAPAFPVQFTCAARMRARRFLELDRSRSAIRVDVDSEGKLAIELDMVRPGDLVLDENDPENAGGVRVIWTIRRSLAPVLLGLMVHWSLTLDKKEGFHFSGPPVDDPELGAKASKTRTSTSAPSVVARAIGQFVAACLGVLAIVAIFPSSPSSSGPRADQPAVEVDYTAKSIPWVRDKDGNEWTWTKERGWVVTRYAPRSTSSIDPKLPSLVEMDAVRVDVTGSPSLIAPVASPTLADVLKTPSKGITIQPDPSSKPIEFGDGKPVHFAMAIKCVVAEVTTCSRCGRKIESLGDGVSYGMRWSTAIWFENDHGERREACMRCAWEALGTKTGHLVERKEWR